MGSRSVTIVTKTNSKNLFLVIGFCYATSMWADAFTHKEERKNPADFANDE